MLCGLCHIALAACACAGAGGGASANPNPDQGSRAASGRRRGGGRDGADALREAAHLSEQRSLRFLPARSGGLLFTVKITEHKAPLASRLPAPASQYEQFLLFFTITHTRPSRTTHTHAHKHSATHVTHTIYVGDDNATCDAAPYEILADARDGVRCMAVEVRARLPTTRRDRQGARGRPARTRRGRLRNI